MSEWQSIETAPKEGSFLVYGPGGFGDDEFEKDDPPEWHQPFIQTAYSSNYGHCVTPATLGRLTHWMPLPPAPQQKGDLAPGMELVVTTQMMEAGIWKLREWLGSWGRTDEQTSDLQAKIGIRSVLSAMLGDRVRFPDLSQKSDEIIPQSDGIGGSRERGD